MADQPIYDRLRTDAPMLGGRIYPRILPDKVAYPAAVYTRVSAPRTHLMKGAPLIEATLQIDVYGEAEKGAPAFQSVVDEVESALDRYKSATTSRRFWRRTLTTSAMTTKMRRACLESPTI